MICLPASFVMGSAPRNREKNEKETWLKSVRFIATLCP